MWGGRECRETWVNGDAMGTPWLRLGVLSGAVVVRLRLSGGLALWEWWFIYFILFYNLSYSWGENSSKEMLVIGLGDLIRVGKV